MKLFLKNIFIIFIYFNCNAQISDYNLYASGVDQLNNGNYEKAIEIFTEFIYKYPSHNYLDKVYEGRGYAYLKLQKYSNAISDFDIAIELNPYNYYAYNSRGIAKQSPKLYPEIIDLAGALDDFKKAIEIEPGFATAYFNRGMLYYSFLDYKKAISDFENAIKLNPNYELKLRSLINEMKSKLK